MISVNGSKSDIPPVGYQEQDQAPDFDSIPDDLRSAPRWVMWRSENREGKPTKVPYAVGGLLRASVNDPATWASFDAVRADFLLHPGLYSGIGFVLTGDDEIICIDLDNKSGDQTRIDEYSALAEKIGSFAEYSSSGKGVHIWIRGKKPGTKCRRGDLEIYDRSRFIAVTGWQVPCTPREIRENQSRIDELYLQIDDPQKEPIRQLGTASSRFVAGYSDDQIITLAESHNSKFSSLFKGDTSEYGGDESRADQALCCILAWYTRDQGQIDSIFQKSGLFREKWNREDYRNRTIQSALNTVSGQYNPRHPSKIASNKKDKASLGEQELPQIIVTDERIRDLADQALDAIYKANSPPFLFKRPDGLCKVLTMDGGQATVVPITEAGMRSVLERVANFDRISNITTPVGTVTVPKPISPPKTLVQDLLENPDINVPYLKGITFIPILTRDNHLLATPGYDEKTQLFFSPGAGLTLPHISESPSAEDVEKSKEIIFDIFQDFPLVSESDRTNLVGCLITSVIRPMIRGVVPLFICDKTQMGSGGSLLCEIIDIVATGTNKDLTPEPKKEEEYAKKLTSLFQAGKSVIIFDNVEGTLSSPSLAIALSSEQWSDRLLGTNTVASFPNLATWLANGNNVQLGLDLPRRCYRCRIAHDMAKPWQRSGFKHPDIRKYVRDNRWAIVGTCLTLARSWLSAGSPAPINTPVMGGFEDWRFVIGGILENAGIAGFLTNLDDMYEQSDVDTPQFERFIEAWYSRWQGTPKTTADVNRHLQGEFSSTQPGEERLFDALPEDLQSAFHHKNFARVLGKRLGRMCEAVLPNGYKVIPAGEKHRAKSWKVEMVETHQQKLNSPSENFTDHELTSKQTHLTHQTHRDGENKGECVSLAENQNSPNSLGKMTTDVETDSSNSSGEFGEFLSKSSEEESITKSTGGGTHIGTGENKLTQTHQTHKLSAMVVRDDPPPSSKCEHPVGNTTPSFDLATWQEHHHTPVLSPPPEYGWRRSGSTGSCVCRGCEETPLRDVKGAFPLCQTHFSEYQKIWEIEHPGDRE